MAGRTAETVGASENHRDEAGLPARRRGGGGTPIHLDRALSPAPSWAALGWLETSIRSYAKYVDVAAKATASDDGESAVLRRERMALEDVGALLDEMKGEG